MMKVALMMVVAAIAVSLGGCVTNPETGQQELPAATKATLKEVAAIGVRRYAREHPDSERLEKVRIALLELSALPETEFTTVGALKVAAVQLIDQRVTDPFDHDDLISLANILAPLLEEYVGKGALSPAATVEVKEFISYLAQALRPIVPRPV